MDSLERIAFDSELQTSIAQTGVIAVVIIDDAPRAVPLAKALLAGGVSVMEITLRTDAAIGALRAIRDEVPEMTTGVGTVLTPTQARECHAAGAAFGVAPGFNPRVVDTAVELGWSFAPGVCTPSDIEGAVERGCRLLKFFPAETAGGAAALQGMQAPYAHLGLKYIPLGGLNADNMSDYFALDCVAAIGGSWLAKPDAIAAEDWNGITKRAQEAISLIQASRS